MGFFSFIVLLAIAYLVWRVTDQLPDLIFRLSEIQRDVAEIRRRLAEQSIDSGPVPGNTAGTATGPAAGTAASTGTAAGSGAHTSGPTGDETGASYTGS